MSATSTPADWELAKLMPSTDNELKAIFTKLFMLDSLVRPGTLQSQLRLSDHVCNSLHQLFCSCVSIHTHLGTPATAEAAVVLCCVAVFSSTCFTFRSICLHRHCAKSWLPCCSSKVIHCGWAHCTNTPRFLLNLLSGVVNSQPDIYSKRDQSTRQATTGTTTTTKV